MAYDAKDPRAELTSAVKAPPVSAYSDVELIEFHKIEPQQIGEGYKTWYGRGQNFILAYTEAEAGAVLARVDQQDEYMAFFTDKDTKLDIETDNGNAADLQYSLAIIPPGNSKITVKQGGIIIRLFSSLSADLTALCSNAEPHPNMPPYKAWPDPIDGFKLRTYPLDPPDESGRFGRIWRSSNMMVNILKVSTETRDPNKLSPHSHDDHEQCSLTLQGDYMHYLRWPWTTNKSLWKEDQHIRCSAPSMTVIPPRAIHTSQSLPPTPCHLIDIFSLPRLDFSKKPGWVLNGDEYPMPQE
uniref:5-deoxy-glucuronate isomerase n=1 Tax=OCS116 cluster bacterium TaxID=2030921 RepID=A0A2A4Z957_9PROT